MRPVGAPGSTQYLVLGGSETDHFFISFDLFCLFRATPAAYGGSQARGPIGAVAAGLRHSHSKAGSEPCLRPTLQLMETLVI